MKIVIRAGGSGTRLWPISRRKNPKQFQAMVGERSLIRETVERIKPLLESKKDFFISVNKETIGVLKKEIPELSDGNIIMEPSGKNTGPAICLEACILADRFGEEAISASLPSDDYISNPSSFRGMLRAAEKFLRNNPEYVVTPCAKANCPDPGYSYIKMGSSLLKGKKIFKAGEWIEKPNFTHCKKIIKSGKYFCHTGMYVWRLKTILDLFRKFHPRLYEICRKTASGQNFNNYAKLEKITVESAITKKAPKVAAIILDKTVWSDLGKWHAIAKVDKPDASGNTTRGKVILRDTRNCLIHGKDKKLVAAIGLRDMVVVLTDDVLLVCPKERSGEVKEIVEEMERKNLKEFI